MTRAYFKEKLKPKTQKFMEICKKAGADYFEEDAGIWKMPKKVGDSRAAISLEKDSFDLGKVNETCDNFEVRGNETKYFKEEAIWIIKTLNKLIPLMVK